MTFTNVLHFVTLGKGVLTFSGILKGEEKEYFPWGAES